jgi:hypothetical protein
MTVALLGRDLLIGSRVAATADAAGVRFVHAAQPADLPPADTVALLLVDWSDRTDAWPGRLRDWCAGAPEAAQPRIVLFGPHTDRIAHQAARAAGLGPMLARSALVQRLPALVAAAG